MLLAVSANDDKIIILSTYENPTMTGRVIKKPAQCQSLRISAEVAKDKVTRLTYTNSGTGILTSALNGVHLYWEWTRTAYGKATTKAKPDLRQPAGIGIVMTNDIVDNSITDEGLSCFALSKDDHYLMSASGVDISLFDTRTFERKERYAHYLATYIALFSQDNDIVAVGNDDSSIDIYNASIDEIVNILTGHAKRVTGLAFSELRNRLVSAGADAQLIVWSSKAWNRLKSCFLQIPSERVSAVHVQFHRDQIHILVVTGALLAIYKLTKLECINQWIVPELSPLITHATLSCNDKLIYSCFLDGTLKIFDAASLQLHFQINPTAYTCNLAIYPTAIAANPNDPNQFAVGISDGAIQVFEPLDSQGRWDPVQNGNLASTSNGQFL